MRAAVLVSLIVAAGLSACATHAPAPATDPAMTWSLNPVAGEGMKLAYGKPQSDDVLVMLTCAPGSKRVRVSALAGHGSRELALGSDGVSRTYAAEAGPAGFGDGFVVESEAASDDPVLSQFARSGALTLNVDGRRTVLPPDGLGQAAKFMKICRFG